MDLDAAREIMKKLCREKWIYLEGLRSRGVFSSQMLRVLAWFFESPLDWRLKMKLWRLGVNEVLTPEAYYL